MGKMVFRCFYVTGVGDNVGSDVISPTTPSFRPSGVALRSISVWQTLHRG